MENIDPKTVEPKVVTQEQRMMETANTIMKALADVDVHTALSVFCNLTGQVVAQMSANKPALIKKNVMEVAANIQRAAFAKAIYDAEHRRG